MRFSPISKTVALLIVGVTLFGYNQNLFSWGLFNLFDERSYSREGLSKALAFDPDKDILYLPKLEGKELFESVEDLSISRKQEVRRYLYVYLTRGRPYILKGIENSHKYSDLIYSIFDEEENRDMPKDLAMLPLLESAFNPYAVSRSKAVGLWQFMSNTSRPLGLKNNRWVDERRDVEKSTRAAIRHLRNLHRTFKSWDLALAAYNGGGGHVRRSMKKSNTTDFWSLAASGTLRKETEEYVPRFLALLLIYRNQGLFDIKEELTPPEVEDTALFRLTYGVHLRHVSKLTGLPVKNILTLNPQLKMGATPPYDRSFELRLPVDAAEKLEKNRKSLYRLRYSRVKKYKVKQGDCLSKIAARHKKKLVTSSISTT